MVKFNISKGWIAYLSFVWGLWVAAFCLVLDGVLVWNMGNTFFFTLHIIANVLALWLSVVKEKTLEEEGNGN